MSTLFLCLFFNMLYGQVVICEGSPCTSNDFTLNTFYLGDENGTPLGPGYCDPGDQVTAYLWIDFTANTAANRYSLLIHFNLYVDGVFTETINECFYEGVPVPVNTQLNPYSFSWECGSEIVLQDFYMSWQPNPAQNCGCTSASCYSDPSIVVEAPLIANFEFNVNCTADYTLDFTSTTTGGIPPYTYFWDFGDGTTSTDETPTHTFPTSGPYTVNLTVFDALNTDSHEIEIVNFPALVSVSIDSFTNQTCEGANDGSATANISGGEAPYTYSWDTVPIQNTQTATNLPDGTYTVTVTDANGCVDTDTITIGTLDTGPPTITAPTDATIEGCTVSDLTIPFPYSSTLVSITLADFTAAGGIAMDDTSITGITYIDTVSGVCPIVITRTFTATDDCNNSATDIQLIYIQDTTNPIASNPADINISCVGDVPNPNVSVVTDAADNCSVPTVTFISDVSDNGSCPEIITRTYRITDDCGNFVDVSQQIIINDEIPPTASNPADINVSCVDDVPNPNVNVVTDEADNCSVPTVTFISDISDNGTCPEIITRTYRITDDCDNFIDVSQQIIINDDILPTASNPADINVSCVDDVPNPSVNVVTDAADNCSIPTVTFISDVSDNGSCPEIITRTYRITDDCGNFIDVTQQIIINDDVLPTASNPADINVSCIDDVPNPNVNVVTDEADNCSIPTVTFISDISDNGSCPEIITRTYRITDDCGNFVDVFQQIIINDDILPTASNPADINVSCVDDVPNPNVNVVADEADNCSIPTVTFISDVSDNGSCPEIITRTYRITDDCGNFIDVTQQIIINDDILPTASNPADINVSCVDDVPNPDVNVVTDAADNCSIPTVTFISDISDNGSCPEIITRTYRITDDCGNFVDVFQQIIVNDDILPTASNPADILVSCLNDVPNPDVNVVTDAANNCSIPIVTFISDVSDNGSCPEIITRTYRITDDCGNFVDVTQQIIINDEILPTASNPVDILVSCVNDVPNPDINVVTDAADNCSVPTVTFISDVSDNGSCPEIITRTYRITDDCGNFIDVTQQIIINDDILPTASNPADINVSCVDDVPNPNVNVVTDAADNCSIPTVTFISDVSDNGSCPEIIIRTYRITDDCGNFIDVSQQIIINDDILPTATNPADILVSCVDDVPNPNVNVVADEADNCSIPTVTFISDVSDNGSCPEIITRTYRITDDCGNFVDVFQQIIINDDILPTASNPADINVSCVDDVPNPNVNVVTDEADNCSVPTVTFISDVSDNGSCPEIITRTYRITDECGNFVDVSQQITITDDIAPTASNPLSLTVLCIDDVPDPDPTVVIDETDNCGVPTVTFVSQVSDNGSCPEIITRTYRITDDCGNFIDVTQQIIINDDILPTATNPVDITVSCVDDVPNPNVNVVTDAADNCTIPTVTFISDVSDNGSCPEIITRTYRITDDCGNFIDVTQQIIINDDILPTASNPANINVSCVNDVPNPDINVVTDEADNCSIPTVTFISDVSDNGSCPEIITRTYRITDDCGNFVDIFQQIIVNDDILPTASNPADINISCVNDVPNPNVNVVTDEADNCSVPTVTFISDVSDNGTCPEIINRTYRITDDCGNFIDVTQQIIINDDISPTASNPADINVSCIDDVPNPDVNVVMDEVDNCSIPTVTFISDVSDNGSCPEIITRTYRITDDCGNFVDVSQQITITDDIAPTASNPLSLTVLCIDDVPDPDPTVVIDETDNCDVPTVTFVSQVSDNGTCSEIITRTYRVTDSCGNAIEVTQEIFIEDTEPPTASNPANITVSCVDDVPNPNVNVVTDAADNCSIPTVTFVSEISNNGTCPEIRVRTYRVEDNCGNATEVTQQIIIDDQIAPVLTSPLDVEMYIICGDVPDIPELTFEDNCTSDVIVTYQEVSTEAQNPSEYAITRTWNAEDFCGNVASFTQTVHMLTGEQISQANVIVCVEDDRLLLNSIANIPGGTWDIPSAVTIIDGAIEPSEIPVGDYILTYTRLEGSCVFIKEVALNVNDDCVDTTCVSEENVKISKVVTPNADQVNDVFKVDILYQGDCDISIDVKLFNRWGNLIFESANYENDWDGKAPNSAIGNATKLPAGTYYYIVTIVNSELKPIQGYIYLSSD